MAWGSLAAHTTGNIPCRSGMDPFQWSRGQPLGLQYSARGHPLTRRNRRRVGLGDGAVGRSAARAARVPVTTALRAV